MSVDQELFTKVTGVTRKYEDIVKDFEDAYGDEATEKLKERVKAWVGEGKVFDFEIDEKYYSGILINNYNREYEDILLKKNPSIKEIGLKLKKVYEHVLKKQTIK